MASAVIGALRVTLGADTVAFEQGMTRAQKEMAKTGRQMTALGGQITKAGGAITLGLTAPLLALGVTSIRAARESREAIGQVNAALKSMGAQSGKTSADLEKSATALMHLSTFDDDDILRKVTANLLTFGKVAGTEFDRAQQAAVDLSARMGGDLQASTILIGKALNDPIKGMGALRKAGIQLTEAQKGQVEQFVKVGNAAGAQRVLLGELEAQFGGSAKALRDASPDAALIQSWDTLQETIGETALDVLPALLDPLNRALEGFNNLAPSMQRVVIGGAAIVAGIGPLTTIIGGTISVGATLSTGLLTLAGSSTTAAGAFTVLGRSMAFLLGPWGLVIGGIATATGLWALAQFKAKDASQAVLNVTGPLEDATRQYEDAVRKAATAQGEEKDKALELVKAKRFLLQARVQNARAALAEANITAKALQVQQTVRIQQDRYNFRGDAAGSLGGANPVTVGRMNQVAADAKEAQKGIAAAEASLKDFERTLNAPLNLGATGNGGGSLGGATSKAKDADEALRKAKQTADEYKAKVEQALDALTPAGVRQAAELAENMATVRDAFDKGAISLAQFNDAMTEYLNLTTKIADAAPPLPSDFSTDLDAATAGLKPMLDQREAVRDAWAQGIEDGVHAGLDGDLLGFIRSRMQSTFSTALSDGLKAAAGAGSIGGGLKAFGSSLNGMSLGDKVNAGAAIAEMVGKSIGGVAGGTISGAASGAALGFQVGGPLGAAAGGLIGGVMGFLSSSKAKKAEKQAAELKKREEELSKAREAAAAAAERLIALEEQHADLQQRLLEVSGDTAGAQRMDRERTLKGLLDDTSRSLQSQIYQWEDWNKAVSAADDAVAEAQAALNEARQEEARALEDQRSDLEDTAASLRDFADQALALRKSLTLGALGGDPSGLVGALGGEFSRALGEVLGGNQKSQQELLDLSSQYVDAGNKAARNQLESMRTLSKVRSGLDQAREYALAQATAADVQIGLLTQQVAATLGVQAAALTIGQLMQNLNDAVANRAALDAVKPATPTAPASAADRWSAGGADFQAWSQSGQGAGIDAARGAQALSDWRRDEASFLAEYRNAAAVGSLSVLDAYWQLPAGTAASVAAQYKLPAFATGGSGLVGGAGGIDSQLIQMRATPGELVSVSRQDTMGASVAALRDVLAAVERQEYALAALARNTREGTGILKQWNGNGLPEERDVA